jgi:hypothetical protein
MAGVRCGTRRKGFVAKKARTIPLREARGTHWNVIKCKSRLGMSRSCHMTSDNQPYSRVWKSLGDSLPKLYCITWRGLCHTRKLSSRIFVSKKGMVQVRPTDVCMRNLWRKAERGRSPVVCLLPGFLEHLALRNPRILCQ